MVDESSTDTADHRLIRRLISGDQITGRQLVRCCRLCEVSLSPQMRSLIRTGLMHMNSRSILTRGLPAIRRRALITSIYARCVEAITKPHTQEKESTDARTEPETFRVDHGRRWN